MIYLNNSIILIVIPVGLCIAVCPQRIEIIHCHNYEHIKGYLAYGCKKSEKALHRCKRHYPVQYIAGKIYYGAYPYLRENRLQPVDF